MFTAIEEQFSFGLNTTFIGSKPVLSPLKIYRSLEVKLESSVLDQFIVSSVEAFI